MTITELLPKLTEEDRKYLEHSAKSEKEVYDYLVSKGLTDSFEEFTDFAKEMEKLSDTELSDDDLEKIAGGLPGIPGGVYTGAELNSMYAEYYYNWQPQYDFEVAPLSFAEWMSKNGYGYMEALHS